MNQELLDVHSGFRRGRGTRDLIVNIHWILEKAKEFQKNIYVCFTDYTKAFDYVDHKKNWKILKEMRIPDHLSCLLRNLYAGQEATLRRNMEWLVQNWERSMTRLYIITLFILLIYRIHHAKYGLDESQAGIKIAGRNTNNHRYANNITLMAETKAELKSLLIRVKEESEKAGLKLNIQKKLRSWHPVPSLLGK